MKRKRKRKKRKRKIKEGWKLNNVININNFIGDFRIDLVISRGEESETVTIYREAEAGETLQDVVREVYEAFNV